MKKSQIFAAFILVVVDDGAERELRVDTSIKLTEIKKATQTKTEEILGVNRIAITNGSRDLDGHIFRLELSRTYGPAFIALSVVKAVMDAYMESIHEKESMPKSVQEKESLQKGHVVISIKINDDKIRYATVEELQKVIDDFGNDKLATVNED